MGNGYNIVGTYEDLRVLLKYKTVGGIRTAVCRGQFRPGVYLGHGRFNITYVKELLERHETPFITRSNGKKRTISRGQDAQIILKQDLRPASEGCNNG
jgi:hypothetical protein